MEENFSTKSVARLARLNSRNGDIQKNWFVQYSYRNPESGKMCQFRISKGLNSIKDCEKRKAKGNAIAEEINTKLKNGYSPYEDHDVIYEDQIIKNYSAKKKGNVKTSKQTIRYFSNLFLEKKTENGIRQGTYISYRSRLKIFDEWLQTRHMSDKDVSVFTEKQAKDFITYLKNDRKIDGKTINFYAALLNNLFKYIRTQRKRLNNPFSEFENFKSDTKITQYYPDLSIKLFKDYFLEHEPQMWLAVQLMYYCYMRPKEIRFLQIKHIHLDEGYILVPADISKVRKDRRPVMPESLRIYMAQLNIESYDPDNYLITLLQKPGINSVSQNYLSGHFRKARKILGISKEHRFYGWKHTGMVKANQAGIPTKDIQNQAGHSSLDMVDKYLRSSTPVESEALRTRFPEI